MYGKCQKCNKSNNLYPITKDITKFFKLKDSKLCLECINDLLSSSIKELINTWGDLQGIRSYTNYDLVVAIDLDGVLSEYKHYEYGYFGEMLPGAKELVNKFRENNWKIVIWTCREKEEARNWLEENGIYFDAINEHPTWKESNCPKPKLPANIFIDDNALFHPRNAEWTEEKINFIYNKAAIIAGEKK